MSNDLSGQVRKVLREVHALLAGQHLVVERPAANKTMQDLLAWCAEHELDTQRWLSAAGRKVAFDRHVLQMIDTTLEQLSLANSAVDLSQGSRFDQAQQGAGENKNVGVAPMQHRVLMAQANCGAYFPEWVTESPSQWVMDIAWQTLQLNAYSHVVVVENRDAFYEYFALQPQRYQLPIEALDALVIYRGNQDESKGCKALREACVAEGKPLIYFGDYDTAGLSIAVHGGYTHILLPTGAALLEQANDVMQEADQLKYAQAVTAFAEQLPDTDPLRTVLLHNTQRQKGLRQQAFSGTLQLLAIARSAS